MRLFGRSVNVTLRPRMRVGVNRFQVQTLVAAGLPVEEYNQTLNNLTEATEALYSVLTTRGIRLYNAPGY